MRNRMYGGVRGRKTKVGGNNFVFLLLDFCLLCSLHFLSVGEKQAPSEKGFGKEVGRACLRSTASLNKQNQKVMSEQLQQVVDLITANTIFCTKEVLTSDEAARYLGISKSYLYKLTMERKIPHFKPMGKMCYFNRQELEQWLQTNRVMTTDDIEQQAQNYCMKGGKK